MQTEQKIVWTERRRDAVLAIKAELKKRAAQQIEWKEVLRGKRPLPENTDRNGKPIPGTVAPRSNIQWWSYNSSNAITALHAVYATYRGKTPILPTRADKLASVQRMIATFTAQYSIC